MAFVNPEIIKPPSNRLAIIIVAIIIFIESVVSESRRSSRLFVCAARPHSLASIASRACSVNVSTSPFNPDYQASSVIMWNIGRSLHDPHGRASTLVPYPLRGEPGGGGGFFNYTSSRSPEGIHR